MNSSIKRALGALCAGAAALFAGTAGAAFPDQPITIIVPSSPGGAIDMVARLVAKSISEKHDASVVVSNRPGATNIIGSDAVAKSRPDGHTLLLASSAHAINPFTAKLPYDTVNDFAPIVLTHSVPLLLVATPELPVRSVQELVDYARANPGKLTFASSGLGGAPHFSGELFKTKMNLDIVHVPYRGSTLAHADLISGRTSIMFDTLAALRAPLDGGKLKPLAVTTRTRAASEPDVPTMQEAGVAGYETETWGGVLAPAGTPPEVIETLQAWINEALSDPELRKRLEQNGIIARGGSPSDFDAFIRAEMAKWGGVAKSIGLEAQPVSLTR